jgi:hypothetical protein
MKKSQLERRMNRVMSVLVALSVAAGCSGATDPKPERPTSETALGVPSASTFAGMWRSVTPSLEFVRLSFDSKSSQFGVLAARLTFSGVAWEGSGRVEGTAFVASMTSAGTTAPTGVIVAQAIDAQTLRVQVRPAGAETLALTFVREN